MDKSVVNASLTLKFLTESYQFALVKNQLPHLVNSNTFLNIFIYCFIIYRIQYIKIISYKIIDFDETDRNFLRHRHHRRHWVGLESKNFEYFHHFPQFHQTLKLRFLYIGGVLVEYLLFIGILIDPLLLSTSWPLTKNRNDVWTPCPPCCPPWPPPKINVDINHAIN